jgi:hypothetical protein
LFKDLKQKYPEGVQAFAAHNGSFPWFKEHSDFHIVKMSGEAASRDAEAVKTFLEWLQTFINEAQYLAVTILNVD